MKKVIVFGNDHTNSVGIIQSLGKVGFKSIALVWGINRGLVKLSKYTDKVISARDPQSCIDKLLNEPVGESPIPIIACSDTAALTLEKNRNALSSHYVFEYSQKYSIEYICKKENQVRMAIEAGFDVPKSWILGESKEIPTDVCYPCLIKPLVSSKGAKSDIRVCKNKDELQKNLHSLNVTKELILQQYIDRDYEISILGCALSDGACLTPVVENKLTLYPKFVGLECLANLQPLQDNQIKSSIEKLILAFGYVGLFSVEMMHCKTDGKFYFTEINPRNDGAESFVTQYGANLPLNHIEDLLGQSLTPMKETHPGYYIWDFHQFQSVLHRDMSIAQFIKEWRMSNGALMYMKGDTKPFYKQYTNWFLEKIKLRKKSEY